MKKEKKNNIEIAKSIYELYDCHPKHDVVTVWMCVRVYEFEARNSLTLCLPMRDT